MEKISKGITFIRKALEQKQFFFLFSIIVFGGLIFLAKFQYMNLILTDDNIFIFYWILAILIFKISAKTSFLLAIVFLFCAIGSVLLLLDTLTEQIGKIIYFLVLIGFIQSYFSKVKET